MKPGIVLTEWSDKENAVVLVLNVYLTVDCKIVGLKLESERGCETEAAMAAFKLGELSTLKPQRK